MEGIYINAFEVAKILRDIIIGMGHDCTSVPEMMEEKIENEADPIAGQDYQVKDYSKKKTKKKK
jgi:hypothetical protein